MSLTTPSRVELCWKMSQVCRSCVLTTFVFGLMSGCTTLASTTMFGFCYGNDFEQSILINSGVLLTASMIGTLYESSSAVYFSRIVLG